MAKYRAGHASILVATDVASRGIDVCNIDAVINYDIPQDSDSYVHRIGRTGRAKQFGAAYTFIYQKERKKLRSIMSTTESLITPFVIKGAVEQDRRDTDVSGRNSRRRQFASEGTARRSVKAGGSLSRKVIIHV